MELSIGEDYILELKKVYNPIKLISSDGEELYITMRDTGFEIKYSTLNNKGHISIDAKNGDINIKSL
jgi:hypothetical protein